MGQDRTDELLAIVAESAPGRTITLQTRLDEIGIDSLEFIELIQSIEAKFGKPIEGMKFAEINTVEDILKAIE